jgi:hypothetical protein
MSRYQEFCKSLWIGSAKSKGEWQERQDEEYSLPRAVGQLVQRMGDFFQCPPGQIRYVDTQANVVTGTAGRDVPELHYDSAKGRYYLDVELGINDRLGVAAYAIRLRLEMVALKHGGLEFHFRSARFQLPDEEQALFEHVAESINQELRESYSPSPKKIGF